MQSIESLHRDAMDLAEEAFIAQRLGDSEKAEKLFSEALKLERQAAEQLTISAESEPTRSILYRSAASLAYNCKYYELADRLVAMGLSGYPPKDILEELRNIYEDITFMRHLRSKGLVLAKNQWLMTLAGDAVKYGGTAADYLMMRVDRVSSLFYRTVERMLKKPYRISGGLENEVKQSYGLYINAFTPASFAVAFQVGAPDKQLELPGFEKSINVEPEVVVDEIMNCLEVFESAEPQKLKEHIVDEEYYENFVGLAKQIAPDGKNIKLVGFTSTREGKDRPVALRKSRKELQRNFREPQTGTPDLSSAPFSYSGVLIHADTPLRGKYGTVKLIDKDTKQRHEIKVSISIMKDVVQPFYEERVVIQGHEKEGKQYLDEINLESD